MRIVIREPGSAITHFVAMLLSLVAASPLLMRSAHNHVTLAAMVVFMASMVLLYGASATYHAVNVTGSLLKNFRKMDHMMIFVLIAGSYTPICLIGLGGAHGYQMLLLIWGIAAAGILIKALWITCPKWFSSLIYIGMGWFCVLIFDAMRRNMPQISLMWLFAGGIFYTVGGVIYALKLSAFNNKHIHFGSHEIFHLFVMAGSACHFICMYNLVRG